MDHNARTEEIRRTLASAHAYIAGLPDLERRIGTMAAQGTPVWAIANEVGIAEPAVSEMLSDILAAVTGRPINPVVTGGLGSDTEPGVTGGYGETGFGSLDTEPFVDNTEPEE